MTLKRLQQYLRRFQQQTGSTLQYVKLSWEGNKIERVTNFKKMRRPVLLIQGYGASRRVFCILEERLRKDGCSVFSLNLGGFLDKFNTNPIPHLARHVAEKIDTLYKRYNIREKLVVIGHSKGGLIGRCYIKEFQGHRRVKKLITLGTPHNGNPWAMLGLLTPLGVVSKSLRQMAPLSPFIRRMNRTPWPPGIEIISIYSKEDTIVPFPSPILKVPAKSKRIKNLEVDDCGHAEFLSKKKVYELIRREVLEDNSSAGYLPIPRKKRKLYSRSKSIKPSGPVPSASRR